MMSTEYPEIIPESFTNPCASYDRDTGDYINGVVIGCHSSHTSLYSNNGYYSEDCQTFDTDSNHHSLLLEDPATGQNHRLGDSPERGCSGRSSYSYEPNVNISGQCIKIVVKEAATDINYSRQRSDLSNPSLLDAANDEDRSPVLVRVEQTDGLISSSSTSSLSTTNLQEVTRNLLRPKSSTVSPSSSFDEFDNCGSPTPTPSYNDVMTTPTVEYPGGEEKAFAVRGGEIALLEEACVAKSEDGVGKEDSSSYPQEKALDEANQKRKRFSCCSLGNVSSVSHDLPLLARRRLSESSLTPQQVTLSIPPINTRKFSDPAAHIRRQRVKTSSEPRKQRCLSDSEAPNLISLSTDEYEVKSEEGGSSALGCDSGFHDERTFISRGFQNNYYSSPRASLHSSDMYSLDECPEVYSIQQRFRRITPHPMSSQESEDTSGLPVTTNPGTMVHPRERTRRSLMKHYSQGSIGGGSIGGASSIGASSESPSLGSLIESQSNMTSAADMLSSLGFDDFDSPQLVPDRFIPVELEYLRPSVMKTAFIEQSFSPDPPRSPDSLTSTQSYNSHAPVVQQRIDTADLPLGATAEDFLLSGIKPGSPVSLLTSKVLAVESDVPHAPPSPSDSAPLYTDTAAIADFTRRILETVPEETASDLSPSPRWLSPRVSIDHSVHDFSEGINKQLGANLVQKVRKRSLPTGREGYRLSIGSLVESDTGDSIHLSVTSYDDEIAAERERERERENYLPAVNNDDIMQGTGRRRRRGVYTPPQTLLSWLSTQKTINEEVDTDPDELPWPFNEQARLRKSLTEISLARISEGNGPENMEHLLDDLQRQESMPHEMSLSPISTPNTRLSPQPTISEEDEEDLDLDDLDLEESRSFHDDLLSSHNFSDFEQLRIPSPVNIESSQTNEDKDPQTADNKEERRLSTTTAAIATTTHQSGPSHVNTPSLLSTNLGAPKSLSKRILNESRPPMLSFTETVPSDMTELGTPMQPDSARSDTTACIESMNNSPAHSCSPAVSPVGSLSKEENVSLITTPMNSRAKPFSLFLNNCDADSSIQTSAASEKEVSTPLSQDDDECPVQPKPPSKRHSTGCETRDVSTKRGCNTPEIPSKRHSTGCESIPNCEDRCLVLDPYRMYSSNSSSDIPVPTRDHTPVMSSRRRRKPLVKQKSVEDGLPKTSRRQAVFGDAPNQQLLGNIADDKNEVGKWMLL